MKSFAAIPWPRSWRRPDALGLRRGDRLYPYRILGPLSEDGGLARVYEAALVRYAIQHKLFDDSDQI